MFERGGEAVAVAGIVAEPVEELGEAPLVGVDVAAPVNGLEVFGEGELGDLAGFFVGAVIAPEVVVVDGLEVGVDGDDAGAGGVERDGGDVVTVDVVFGEDAAHCFDESAHLVGVGLGGVVGVFAFAGEGVFGGGCAEASADAVEERYTNAEGSEVDSCNDCHVGCLAENAEPSSHFAGHLRNRLPGIWLWGGFGHDGWPCCVRGRRLNGNLHRLSHNGINVLHRLEYVMLVPQLTRLIDLRCCNRKGITREGIGKEPRRTRSVA